MQETEKEQRQAFTPADLNSQPLKSIPQVGVPYDDPDEIFFNAVAEIDTQPLVLKKKFVTIRLTDVLQVLLCGSLIVGSMFGMVWQVITYPKTLVILSAVEKPKSITTPLEIPTRTLASVTLTRSLTTPTTGRAHQDARAASGTVTFYNGQNAPQHIPGGTVFTGQDGVKITIDQSALVPAANLPTVGVVTISARAVAAGSTGNIAPYDIHLALSGDLTVKNQTSFTKGLDARDFQAVAQQDIENTTAQGTQALSQEFQTAFIVLPGEQAQPTNCHPTTTANHQPGAEAQRVTVHISETCSAIAYSQNQLQLRATQTFTAQTKPGKNYTLIRIQTNVVRVAPLTARLNGSWVYVLTGEYKQHLAEQIAGETPAQARKYLLATGVIAQASVPATLPASMYIEFLVLEGK